MLDVLAEGLGVPVDCILPFDKWLLKVQDYPATNEENPAASFVDFLGQHFVNMSCGRLVLDTSNSQKHSETLRTTSHLGRDQVLKYISVWKESGFLKL